VAGEQSATASSLWPWRRRQNDVAKSPVDRLIGECELVAEYAIAAGLLKDTTFFDKFAAVQALKEDERLWSNVAIRDLRVALAQSREAVPFPVVSALKAGWSPQRDRLREKAKNLVFVAASLFLMFAVGYSTMTYNRGVQLFQDLSAMKERNPSLLYGRLERQIHLAERKLHKHTSTEVGAEATAEMADPAKVAAAVPALVESVPAGERSYGNPTSDQPAAGSALPPSETSSLETLLTQDASFQYVHDLSELDKELKLFEDQSDEFLRRADYQLYLPTAAYMSITSQIGTLRETVCSWWLVRWLSCALPKPIAPRSGISAFVNKIACGLGGGVFVNCMDTAEEIARRYEQQYRSLSAVDVKNFCRDILYVAEAAKQGWDAPELAKLAIRPEAERVVFLRSSNYLFDDALGIDTIGLMLQNCRLNLNYLSQSIPNIVDLQSKVASRLATYSFIALPALYGALGSLMYFMRRIIDPLLPNPTLMRMVSRVALGALAGMSLAWLWDGMFASDEALKTVGFGLFVLAFICGFAIDVFFALLQQLVTIATGAVERIGAPREGRASVADSAPPGLPPGG
jgi:hypothetical protein